MKDKVLELISIQEDILLPTDIGELYNSPDSLKRLAYAVFDKAHIKLLKSGHASVYNKLEKKYEDKIFYYKNRNKLGNTSTFFCFPNGKVFYSNLIAFGE